MLLLNGKEVAYALNEKLRLRVNALKERSVFPTLSILRVGNRQEDIAYERSAVKRCESVGIRVIKNTFSETISEQQLEEEITKINENSQIHGCLIFRPLPKHIDEKRIRQLLFVKKDVDGITDGSMASVYANTKTGFTPCTAQSCIEVLDYYDIDVSGKSVVVVGRSLVIGKPVAMLLLSKNATVTVCHTKTNNLPEVCKKAEIIIAAAGQAKMITDKFVSPGQIVVDVGINVDDNGNLCGDVDYSSVEEIVGAITPVPGGVGPVTTSVLAKHLIIAAENSNITD